MSDVWFIGDTHFSHSNILVYEAAARPFKSVGEMNEVLIHSWNSVVRSGDKVYHLGDFCFGRENIKIANRLNGYKYLIMGNHDRYTTEDYLQYFKALHGMIFWEECILSHMPVHPDQLHHRAKYNIHGHLHSRVLPDKRYINVSCEQNNLIPISADEIRKRWQGKSNHMSDTSRQP